MARVEQVPWENITAASKALVASWHPPDVVIGISRGGVPIATTLSYAAPNVPVAFVTRVAARGNNDPFYVFHGDREQRYLQNKREFIVSELPHDVKRILVVDDVVTFGGTLKAVTEKILEKSPLSEVFYYCYAADRQRLRLAQPQIDKRLASAIEIDNERLWLRMPWQVQD